MKFRLAHCVSGIKQNRQTRTSATPHTTWQLSPPPPSDNVSHLFILLLPFSCADPCWINSTNERSSPRHPPPSKNDQVYCWPQNRSDVAPMLEKQKSQTYIHGSGFALTRDMNKLIQRALLGKIWTFSLQKHFDKNMLSHAQHSPGRNSLSGNARTHRSRYNAIAGSGWCCQSHWRGVGAVWQLVAQRAALWLHRQDAGCRYAHAVMAK